MCDCPEPQPEIPQPQANPRFATLQAAFDMYHRNLSIMSSLVHPNDDGMHMGLLAPLRADRQQNHLDRVS
ncbi:hypothetical protein DY000_02027700 [Brassica cretica]|uniref:Uncharacterized protein n=1 Tax=Brassica cretica TaxID=69181 RepID=A0ABQ7EJG4_BRACR|nr:hypothetical protein DY000_02027700 [Brassica cretica]